MNKWIFLFSLVSLFSCYQENHYESNNDALMDKIDSLQNKVEKLQKQIAKNEQKDTFAIRLKESSNTVNQKEAKPNNKTEKKTQVVTPINAKIKIPDSIIYKYKNGKKSAVEGSFKKDKKKITLYNKKGEITYVFEDVRSSYQINTTLKFREDGSVESANVHLNPGASLNWYESNITFDNDNNPLVKTDTEMPLSLEKMMNEKPWFWNPTKKEWYRQEIVREMNTPSN